MYWAPEMVPCDPGKLADGSADSFVKQTMDFLEFRDYVENFKLRSILDVMKRTKADPRLDLFLNGRTHEPTQIFRKALRIIKMRNFEERTLLQVLRRAQFTIPCICSGRFKEAFEKFSKSVRLPKRLNKLQGKSYTIYALLLMWAKLGRVRGNTLCFVGPSGTGKSWTLNALKECLNHEFYEIPQPIGSYPLARLGLYWPPTRAFLLDELSIRQLKGMLGDEGFWKRWLTLQTSGSIRPAFPKNGEPDRENFSYEKGESDEDSRRIWFSYKRIFKN
ncbi:unnamed protein product [Amoebophrya sp. A25]|nr:unnamed protein product [Amoebophrya sp. A25]|eukprot:GSA25T00027859001.1